jgi:hypothetical protein
VWVSVTAIAFAIPYFLLNTFVASVRSDRATGSPKSEWAATATWPNNEAGRGGGIRTPKSGFGDQQFNR